jgi:hypothetical protein
MNKSFSDIWNCPEAFEFICTKQWDSLNLTDVTNVRHCDVCSENVYLSSTPEEFVHNSKLGRCVAVPKQAQPSAQKHSGLSGRVSPEFAMHLAEQQKQYKVWWNMVLNYEPYFILSLIKKEYPDVLEFLIGLGDNVLTENFDLLGQAYHLLSNSEERDKFALHLIEIGQVDEAVKIAKTLQESPDSLMLMIRKLVEMDEFGTALEFILTLSDHKAQLSGLRVVVGKLQSLGQIEAAIESCKWYLSKVNNLPVLTKASVSIMWSVLIPQSIGVEEAIAPTFIPDPPEVQPDRKAMTWCVLDIVILNGIPYALFGTDSLTNPYQGDTDTNSVLPLLCFKKMGFPRPVGLPNSSTTNGGALRGSWSGGKVLIVPDVHGKTLTSQAVADEYCRRQGLHVLGEDGFRMAEFHDGDRNAGWAGWDFWADASAMPSLRISDMRYWVSINDQPANPWS